MDSLIFTWIFVHLIAFIQAEDMRLVLSFNVVGPDKNYRAFQEILLLSNSADWLKIMCTVVNGPVHRQVDSMSIYRLSANDTFKLVATIQSYESDAEDYREPSSISHDIPGIKAVGSLKDEIEYLEVSIPVAELTCEFSSMKKCSVSYSIKDGSQETKGTTSITRNLKLAANPSTLSLTVTHDDDVSVSSIKHSLHEDYAALHTGDVIQLKCRANIGTRTFAVIRWKKNTSFAHGALLPYIPGDAQLTKGFAGLINGSTCLYEKTDIIKYTITDEDSARPPPNPLQFQCYVLIPIPFWETPESSRKSGFVSVHPMTTTSITTRTTPINSSVEQVSHVHAGNSSEQTVTFYIGIVIGLLAALTTILATFLLMRKYKIRCIMLCEHRGTGKVNTCKVKATLNPVYSISSTSSESSITTTETLSNYEDLDDESTCHIYETLHEYHEIDDLEE